MESGLILDLDRVALDKLGLLMPMLSLCFGLVSPANIRNCWWSCWLSIGKTDVFR